MVDPFVRYLFLALVILIVVRFVVGRLGLRSMFANPPLAEAASKSASSRPSLRFGSECARGVLSRELWFAKILIINDKFMRCRQH
jgi:hypothetical protein